MATKKTTKKVVKEVEEVEVEKVAQAQGKPMNFVITPSGKLLKLTDAELKEFKKKD